jgi:cell division protein FtsB
MSKFIDFLSKNLSRLNKYVIVIAIFVAFTFLIGDGNLYKRYKYDEKIRSLEREIDQYTKEMETNKKKIQELQTDKAGIEQFAREEYLMKRENEDLFIIGE